MFKLARRALAAALLLSLSLCTADGRRAKAQTTPRAGQQQQQQPRVVAALRGHTSDIIDIGFSPDGRTLSTGAEDGTVRLWDAATGAHKATLKLSGELRRVTILWSPDSSLLVTDWGEGLGSNKGHAQIWDARTGRLSAALAGHRWDVNSFDWSPDSRHVLTASEDGTARVWDARTGSVATEIIFEKINADDYTNSILKDALTRKQLPEYISLVARYVDGGRNILVSSSARPGHLYTAAGAVVAPLNLTPPPSKDSFIYYPPPVVSPDTRLVVTRGAGGAVRVWDAATGARRYTIAGAGSECHFSPDGRALLTTWRGGASNAPPPAGPHAGAGGRQTPALVLWDAQTGDELRGFYDLPAPYRLHWSPDGARLVVVGVGETKTRLLDVSTGRVVAKLSWEGCGPDDAPFGDGTCDPFVFSPDGRLTVKLKGELQLISAETGELVATLPETNRRAAFHPTNSRLLAARSKDKKSILIFELAAK